jgi:hypothetical protein
VNQTGILYNLVLAAGLTFALFKVSQRDRSFPKGMELIACLVALGSLFGLSLSDRFNSSVLSWFTLGLACAFIGSPGGQWSSRLNGGLLFSSVALWVNTLLITYSFSVHSWSGLSALSGKTNEWRLFLLQFSVALLAAGDLFLRASRQRVSALESVTFWIAMPLGVGTLFQLASPLHVISSIESTFAVVAGLLLLGFGAYRIAFTQSIFVFVRLTCSVSTIAFISMAPLLTTDLLMPLAGVLAGANLALLNSSQAGCGPLPNAISILVLTLGPILALGLSENALTSLGTLPGAFPFLCAVTAFYSFATLRFTLSLPSGETRIPKIEWALISLSLVFGAYQLERLPTFAPPSFTRALCLFGSWFFACLLAGALSRNPRYQVGIETSLSRLPERLSQNRDFMWLDAIWRMPIHLAGSLGIFFSLWNVGSLQYGLVVFLCGVILLFWAALKTQVLW